jgi:hypothetical protein
VDGYTAPTKVVTTCSSIYVFEILSGRIQWAVGSAVKLPHLPLPANIATILREEGEKGGVERRRCNQSLNNSPYIC